MKENYNRKIINQNEIPKYKKKSENKPPTKSKHKHDYEDCLFEWDNPNGHFTRETGWITQHEVFGGSYCKICGKIKHTTSFEWHNIVYEFHGYCPKLSERAKQEINPETRTLPLFKLDDFWNQKYIDIT